MNQLVVNPEDKPRERMFFIVMLVFFGVFFFWYIANMGKMDLE
jgi:cytochrome c1